LLAAGAPPTWQAWSSLLLAVPKQKSREIRSSGEQREAARIRADFPSAGERELDGRPARAMGVLKLGERCPRRSRFSDSPAERRRREERRLLRLVQVGSERDIAGLVRLELV
jgi:hypothetical protein